MDNDGKIDRKEIQNLLHSESGIKFATDCIDVQKMIDEADLDGDGKIDYG